MQRRDTNAPNAPALAGAYSQAVQVTGSIHTLWISGQVGAAIDGTVPADALAHAKLAWASLIAQLEAAGMGIDSIAKLVTMVPNAADIPATRAARSEVLGDRKHVDRGQSGKPGLEGRDRGGGGALMYDNFRPGKPRRFEDRFSSALCRAGGYSRIDTRPNLRKGGEHSQRLSAR